MRLAMASDCWPSVTMVVDSLPTTTRSQVPSMSKVTDSRVTPTYTCGSRGENHKAIQTHIYTRVIDTITSSKQENSWWKLERLQRHAHCTHKYAPACPLGHPPRSKPICAHALPTHNTPSPPPPSQSPRSLAHLFGHVSRARGYGDVLQHVLAAGPEPGRLDGHHVQHPAHLRRE